MPSEPTTNLTFENNVVGPYTWSNSTGIQVSCGATNILVYNNTFVGCSQNGIVFDAGNGATSGCASHQQHRRQLQHGLTLSNGATLTHTNNLFFGNVLGDFSGTTADPTEITGEDPLFVNAAAGNYQLLYGSPAIDTGVNVGLPYFGSAPDMGAFEYAGGIIYGTVTSGGVPLAGATVSITSGTATTGAAGTYTIHTTAGTYDVTATLRTYSPLTHAAQVVPAGGGVEVDFALSPAPPTTYYVAGLGAPGDGGQSDTNDGLAAGIGWRPRALGLHQQRRRQGNTQSW